MQRADDLPTETIRGVVDNALATAPFDVRFVELYIFGSFGAKVATDTSDVDVLVAVENRTGDEVIENATSLFRHGTYEVGGRQLDIAVTREQDAPSYLRRACRLGGYELVYDVYHDRYVSHGEL